MSSVGHVGYLGESTAAITQPAKIPSCLRGISLVPGCSIAHLLLHHTFQFSPEANLARDLRSKTVLQSSSLPQAGFCPCISAPPAWHRHQSSPGVGVLFLNISLWRNTSEVQEFLLSTCSCSTIS